MKMNTEVYSKLIEDEQVQALLTKATIKIKSLETISRTYDIEVTELVDFLKNTINERLLELILLPSAQIKFEIMSNLKECIEGLDVTSVEKSKKQSKVINHTQEILKHGYGGFKKSLEIFISQDEYLKRAIISGGDIYKNIISSKLKRGEKLEIVIPVCPLFTPMFDNLDNSSQELSEASEYTQLHFGKIKKIITILNNMGVNLNIKLLIADGGMHLFDEKSDEEIYHYMQHTKNIYTKDLEEHKITVNEISSFNACGINIPIRNVNNYNSLVKSKYFDNLFATLNSHEQGKVESYIKNLCERDTRMPISLAQETINDYVQVSNMLANMADIIISVETITRNDLYQLSPNLKDNALFIGIYDKYMNNKPYNL